MISSALSSDSDDVTKLLNVSLDLITASNSPPTHSNSNAPSSSSSSAAKQKQKKDAPGSKLGGPKSKRAGLGGMDGLKGGAAIADSERAVEVLSFLVSKTKVGGGGGGCMRRLNGRVGGAVLSQDMVSTTPFMLV